MLIGNVIVILIIGGSIAYAYLKSTVVKTFAALIAAICAIAAAFQYFEVLANALIGRSDEAAAICPWAQALSFLVLFILVFSIFETVLAKLGPAKVDLGFLPERIGRVICGFFLGMVLAGFVLCAAAMAPLPNEYPYTRFEGAIVKSDNANKVLFNADGFAVWWFDMLSDGSFSGKQNFDVIHPEFMNELFLNRQGKSENIPTFDASNVIQVPAKNGAWLASEGLEDAAEPNKPMESKEGGLVFVRVGFNRNITKNNGGKFMLSQLRLVCVEDGNLEKGQAIDVYPIGYIKAAGKLERKKLTDTIELKQSDFSENVRWIDFGFLVSKKYVPQFVAFRQSSIAKVSALAPADQAPAPEPFEQVKAEKTKGAEETGKKSR